MSNERERIEHLLAEGKISTEEAERLRAAMERSETRAPVAPEPLAKPRLSRLAVASALGLPAAVTAGLLVHLLGLFILLITRHPDKNHVLDLVAVLTALVVILASAIAGIASLVAVGKTPDRLRGRGLAILGLVETAVILWALWMYMLPGRPMPGPHSEAASGTAGTAVQREIPHRPERGEIKADEAVRLIEQL